MTARDLEVLQLALDTLSTDVSRRQKAALRQRDNDKLSELHALGGDVIACRRRLFEFAASGSVPE